jgi:Bacteriophage related domain of unknown function
MSDAAEVAIESALLSHAAAFANNAGYDFAKPNMAFTPPTVSASAKWLRGTFLPAPTATISVGFSSANQHNGIFQLDVFYAQGAGELAPARIGTDIISWFRRGTELDSGDFTVRIIKAPYRGPLLRNMGSDPWVMLPISIPYIAFADNPA